MKVAWLVGVGVLLASCGGTSQKPPGGAPACASNDSCAEQCTAGGHFCAEGQIWECGANGKSAKSIETCGADAACVTAGKIVKCQSAAAACKADELQCRDGDVFKCDAAGATFRLYESCVGRIPCDPMSFTCPSHVCQPATSSCDGARVTTCNDAGTDHDLGTDCAAMGLICYMGQCQSPACKAGSTTCVDNDLYSCHANQVDQILLGTCQFGHCEQQTPEKAACTMDVCSPGQKTCDGNLLKVCTKTGTLPAEGTNCGNDVCEGGECLPVVCEPLKRMCKEGNVHECLSPGTHSQTVDECADDYECGPLADDVACLVKPCVGNAVACVGNVSGKCAPNGLSLSEVQQDCAATSQVCDAARACSTTAVDTEGKAEDVEPMSGGQLNGNIIDVHSNRRVTKLEANLLLDAPRDLRWVIFEWTGFEFESKLSEITTNNSGSGFFSAPALTFELQAGKRYLLGVGLVAGEGYVYFDGAPWSRTLSFGNALGSSTGSNGATYPFEPTVTLYQLRVTTTLP